MNEIIRPDSHDIEILRLIISHDHEVNNYLDRSDIVNALLNQGYDSTVTTIKLLQLEKEKK